MKDLGKVRRLFYRDGVSLSEISKKTGYSRRRGYMQMRYDPRQFLCHQSTVWISQMSEAQPEFNCNAPDQGGGALPWRQFGPGKWLLVRMALLMHLSFFALLALSGPVQAADSGPATAPAIAYLEDPSGRLTIEQVAAPGMAPRFQPTQRQAFFLGWNESIHWFRFTLPAGSANVLVRSGSNYTEFLDFFRPRPGSGFDATHAGSHRPFANQEFNYRFPVFRMTPSPGGETHFYLRASSSQAIQIPLQFMSEEGFDSIRQSDNMRFGMYLGFVLAMALYNLFLYLGARDRAYLWYVVWVVAFAGFMAVHNGVVFVWVLRESPPFTEYSAGLPVLLEMAMLVGFTRCVLGLGQRAPRLDRVARMVQWSAWGVMAVALVGGITPGSFKAITLYIVAALMVSAVSAVLAWKQGYQPARYVVIAMGALWASGLFVNMHHSGLISGFDALAFFFAYDGGLIASALETVLFAFALADRINLLKEDKENALAQVLEAARHSEQDLEARIAERTALARARDEAEHANLAKTRFLAAASHDLRQPMHAIGLLVGALREQLGGRASQHLAQQIEGAVEALDGLFNAILDISRLDSGVVTTQPTTLSLQWLFDRLERNFGPAARAKGLRLRVRPTMARVQSDAVLLDRILANLVSNALRYTESGGVLVAARVHGGSLRIEVRDSGVGIPVDQQAAVFEEFVQLHNPGRDRAQGLGLGLAIVKRLAALLDHPLSLSSRPGQGSVLAVTVPLLDFAAPVPPFPDADPGVDLRGLFVVVVDDEEAILNGMAALLGQAGAHVVAASSGPAAVAALAEHLRPPDLIVSDYRLAAGHDGLDAIRLIRENQGAGIPALLITGESSAGDLEAVKASGLPVLFKPVSAARMRREIADAVAAVTA